MNIRINNRSTGTAGLAAIILFFLTVAVVLTLAATPPAYAYDSEELAFLTLINDYRQANGVPPLTMSNSLYNASEWFSNDMAVYNYFPYNHVSRDGRTFSQRIRDAGYYYNTWLGENIAAGYVTAAQVFEGWRDSPGHNANMLNANYRAIGIGRAYNAGSYYGWYWTTDFGGVSEDNTPPSVSIPYPTGDTRVSGTVEFTANATDNAGIAQVSLYIDDVLVATDTTAPYSYSWDTTAASPGGHTLKAVATDPSGFSAQATLAVTVDNFTPTHRYLFTWYDQSSADWHDWVMLANPAGGAGAARASVKVGATTYADREMAAGAPANAPAFPGLVGGPVTVNSTQALIASQRVIYRNSFNEIPAVPVSELEPTYYFTWYDSNAAGGMRGNWILIGNQGSQTANVEVYIGGELKGTYSVAPGDRITPSWANLRTGPVKVTSTNNQPLIVSQRVLYKDSFNEVLGVPASRLTSEYLFSWYDFRAENNMRGNWVLISNQDTGDAEVEVYVAGQLMGTYTVPEGTTATPQFPGVMGGPVRVVSTNGKQLMISQRVLYKDSFEEVQGATAADAATELWFTWYDSKRANYMGGNWILVANQGSVDAQVEVYIDNVLKQQTTIPVGGNLPVTFSETMGGPVRVVSTNGQPLLASQRVLYKDSFNEILGMQLR